MQHPGARPSHEPARFWSRTTDRAFALVVLLGTGVCSAPPAAYAQNGADGFIFQVSPDGRLIDTAETTSSLRSFTGDDDAQNGPLPDRLFLFATPHSRGDADPLSDVTAAAAVAPRAVRASPEILHAIETAAFRYGSHDALRQAGLSGHRLGAVLPR